MTDGGRSGGPVFSSAGGAAAGAAAAAGPGSAAVPGPGPTAPPAQGLAAAQRPGSGPAPGPAPAEAPALAVLASGRGSNFVAIAEAVRRGDLPMRLALVLSDVPGAPVLERAAEFGVPTVVVEPAAARDETGRYSRRRYGDLVLEELLRRGVEYVALAGFMRLLGGELLRRYAGRIVNIHPSLLPAFPGLEPQRQALEYGVCVTGCTVHLVDEGMDTGPIIAQRAVPVEPGDTVETLTARILEAEHDLYWRALKRLATEKFVLDGRRVKFVPPAGRE